MTFIVSIGPSIDVVTQTDPGRQGQLWLRAGRPPGQRRRDLPHRVPGGRGHQRDTAGQPCAVRHACPSAVEHLDRVRRCRRTRRTRAVGTPPGLTTWADRFAACDAVLARIVDRDRMVCPSCGACGTRSRTGGTDPISNLAATVGWSRQHLARRFRDEFGFGPKLAARVAERGEAHAAGHTVVRDDRPGGGRLRVLRPGALDRDFAELAGCTPTAWLAEELPTSKTTPPPPCDRRAMATTTRHPTVWPVLSYRDARGALDFLAKAFGFEERRPRARTTRRSSSMPRCAGPWVGASCSAAPGRTIRRSADAPPATTRVSCATTPTLFERVAAGADVVRGLVDEDYGSRGFTVRDPGGQPVELRHLRRRVTHG